MASCKQVRDALASLDLDQKLDGFESGLLGTKNEIVSGGLWFLRAGGLLGALFSFRGLLDEDFFVDTEDHISLLNILCDEVGDYK
jgi:hypothetical protein